MNHKPQTEDDSLGFWRRIRCIPFKAKFMGDNADKNLIKKLEMESEGILAWLVKACLLWQEEGLKPTPYAISEETKDYQAENDDLFDFISYLTNSKKITEMKTLDVYKKYQEWAEQQGFKRDDVMTRNAFGRRMSDRYERVRKSDGIYYKNIEITTYSGTECSNIPPFTVNPSEKNSIRTFMKTGQITTLLHKKNTTKNDEFDVEL